MKHCLIMKNGLYLDSFFHPTKGTTWTSSAEEAKKFKGDKLGKDMAKAVAFVVGGEIVTAKTNK